MALILPTSVVTNISWQAQGATHLAAVAKSVVDDTTYIHAQGQNFVLIRYRTDSVSPQPTVANLVMRMGFQTEAIINLTVSDDGQQHSLFFTSPTIDAPGAIQQYTFPLSDFEFVTWPTPLDIFIELDITVPAGIRISQVGIDIPSPVSNDIDLSIEPFSTPYNRPFRYEPSYS